MSSPAGGTAAPPRDDDDPYPFAVRTVTDAELDMVGAVVRGAYQADDLVGPRYLAVVADARSRARTAIVGVAVTPDGRIVGSVTFALAGSPMAQLAREGQAEFRMLGVDPAARGRGVGGALVDWCLDRARAAGVREVVLCSATRMRAAHRLYALRGFVRRPELDWSPESGVELLGFALPLEPTGR